jgi:hypothetical protein
MSHCRRRRRTAAVPLHERQSFVAIRSRRRARSRIECGVGDGKLDLIGQRASEQRQQVARLGETRKGRVREGEGGGREGGGGGRGSDRLERRE